MKVLSIIRFKPKPNHLEDVIENLKAHNKKVRKLLNQKNKRNPRGLSVEAPCKCAISPVNLKQLLSGLNVLF